MPESNKIKYGISNVHYAVMASDGTYGAVKALPGAVSISFASQGDRNVFYADNIEYWVSNTNNGYEGDLEVARLTDELRKDLLGETLEAPDKVLIETSDGSDAIRFALGFQVEGDAKDTKFWFLNCTASRPAVNSTTTEENITPQTDSISIKASPTSADGVVRVKTTDDTTTAIDEGWFSSVYVPTL